MNKLYYVVVLSCLIVACNDAHIEKHYYPSGALQAHVTVKNGMPEGITTEFYETGEVKTISYLRKGIISDTVKGFYRSGNLELIQFSDRGTDSIYTYYDTKTLKIKSKGPLRNGKMYGWHFVFNESGQLVRKIEIIDIGRAELFVNRFRVYNDKGELVDSLTADYKAGFSKITRNQNQQLKIAYHRPSSQKDLVYFCFNDNINEDFSNLKKLKLDTILVDNGSVLIDVKYKKTGLKNFRGFFEEKRYETFPSTVNDTLVNLSIRTFRMYVDIPIKVLK